MQLKRIAGDVDVAVKHKVPFMKFPDNMSFPPEEQGELLRHSRGRRYPSDSIVLFQGDENRDTYLIMKGSVKIVLVNENGREIILCKLQSGDYFGEVSAFNRMPRSVTVVTIEDSEFLVIPPNVILDQVKKDPQTALQLLLNMSKKLSIATELINDLVFLSARQRVAKTLLNYPVEMDDGHMVISRPPTKDIVAITGMSRETVSRILRDFSEKNLIRMSRKNIIIYNELKKDQDLL